MTEENSDLGIDWDALGIIDALKNLNCWIKRPMGRWLEWDSFHKEWVVKEIVQCIRKRDIVELHRSKDECSAVKMLFDTRF